MGECSEDAGGVVVSIAGEDLSLDGALSPGREHRHPSVAVRNPEADRPTRNGVGLVVSASGPVATRLGRQKTEKWTAPKKSVRDVDDRRRGGASPEFQASLSPGGRRNEVLSTGGSTDECTCRICMDRLESSDFAVGRALRLGCRCSAGLGIMHLKCARTWFRIKKSTICEVCGGEAENLPQGLKEELRELARAEKAAKKASNLDGMRNRAGISSRQQSESLVSPDGVGSPKVIIPFCLLPAALSTMLLIVVYYEFLGMGVLPSVVLSVVVASATGLHWFASPKPLPHMLFVGFFLLTVIATTFFLVELEGWEAQAAAIVGVVVPGLFAAAVFISSRFILSLKFRDLTRERGAIVVA